MLSAYENRSVGYSTPAALVYVRAYIGRSGVASPQSRVKARLAGDVCWSDHRASDQTVADHRGASDQTVAR